VQVPIPQHRNIVAVQRSQIELGIEPFFWQNHSTDNNPASDVLPLVRPG
jgi:hypothetical protein